MERSDLAASFVVLWTVVRCREPACGHPADGNRTAPGRRGPPDPGVVSLHPRPICGPTIRRDGTEARVREGPMTTAQPSDLALGYDRTRRGFGGGRARTRPAPFQGLQQGSPQVVDKGDLGSPPSGRKRGSARPAPVPWGRTARSRTAPDGPGAGRRPARRSPPRSVPGALPARPSPPRRRPSAGTGAGSPRSSPGSARRRTSRAARQLDRARHTGPPSRGRRSAGPFMRFLPARGGADWYWNFLHCIMKRNAIIIDSGTPPATARWKPETPVPGSASDSSVR